MKRALIFALLLGACGTLTDPNANLAAWAVTPACETDSECMQLCQWDAEDCDGGPEQ